MFRLIRGKWLVSSRNGPSLDHYRNGIWFCEFSEVWLEILEESLDLVGVGLIFFKS